VILGIFKDGFPPTGGTGSLGAAGATGAAGTAGCGASATGSFLSSLDGSSTIDGLETEGFTSVGFGGNDGVEEPSPIFGFNAPETPASIGLPPDTGILIAGLGGNGAAASSPAALGAGGVGKFGLGGVGFSESPFEASGLGSLGVGIDGLASPGTLIAGLLKVIPGFGKPGLPRVGLLSAGFFTVKRVGGFGAPDSLSLGLLIMFYYMD
jgi:hypothetical protein